MPTPVYITLCLLVPVLWAVASVRLFDWWQQRARRGDASSGSPGSSALPREEPDGPDMYYI